MELCEGDLVYALFEDPQILAQLDLKRGARQFLRAIDFMHSHGCAHLDIKLDNILVKKNAATQQWDFKLTDLGMCSLCTEKKCSRVRGTPGYRAPEIRAGKYYNAKPGDIFAAGVVLLIMFFKYVPFRLNTKRPRVQPELIKNGYLHRRVL